MQEQYEQSARNQPGHANAQPSAPAPVPYRKKRWVLPVLAAVVILAIAVTYLLVNRKDSNVTSGDKPVEQIAQLPASETFYEYFQNAAQQQKVAITKHVMLADSPADEPHEVYYSKSHFDYQSKRYVYAEDILNGDRRDKARCNNDKQYDKLSIEKEWREQMGNNPLGTCMPQLRNLAINDGLNTGGLTKEQSQTFVKELQKRKGLITVQHVKQAEHKGKRYLRYSVDIKPIPFKDPATGRTFYDGATYLEWAFDETGLDEEKHPYTVVGASANGIHLEYYVDPKTRLPVYSEAHPLPGKDSEGKDKPISTYYRHRITYQFGSTPFDLEASKDADLALDW
ncbi:MAG TPA: hypothetical protein VJ836_06015 [Candidatus Saccharimonadales bacterium]|nr:hypothetical protein [Candidatus Saccharimonadales bacterium]